MDTTLVHQNIKYNKTSLIRISSKGDKFYVAGTRPVELYEGKTKQDRLSTGTSDERIAHKMWDKLEAQLYSKWDKLLNRDPFIELASTYWDDNKIGQSLDEARNSAAALISGAKTHILRILMTAELLSPASLNQFYEYLDIVEARKTTNDANLLWGETPNPYPANIQQRRINEGKAEEILRVSTSSPTINANHNKAKPELVLNKTGCPTILEMLPLYEQDTTRWKDVTIKEKRTALAKVKNIAALLGDLPIDQIRSHHATIIARTLDEDESAKSTISKWVRSLKLMLDWCKSTDTALARNLTKQPPENWIDHNYIAVKDVSNYGLKARKWEPFTEDQLYKLFALPMPEKDRLLLSILATTGMRLDEAALLTWEQVKEINGIRYFDLTEAKVKNSNSRRKVALPDVLKLPKPDADPTAKLFAFRLDEDGKSSKHASHHLNSNYAHKVRCDADDNRKVIHSFRHNMITFMVNLDPTPSSEVMDWTVGHDEDGGTKSMRRKNYAHDIALERKYQVVNAIKHPWLNQPN
jgi:integrase